MAIKIVVSATVVVPIKGVTLSDDGSGREEPFDFSLVCKRIDEDQIKAMQDNEVLMRDAVLEHTVDWKAVLDEGNQPVPFSRDSLKQLLTTRVALSALAFQKLVLACGAKGKAKN